MKSKLRNTTNNFELLATARTVEEGLASLSIVQIESDSEDYEQYEFEVNTQPGADIIIHIFPGEDGPGEFFHVRNGQVSEPKGFMYTKRYLKCHLVPGPLKVKQKARRNK